MTTICVRFPDFSWNCAVQLFQSQAKFNDKTKQFEGVARGFHFSAEYRIFALTEERSQSQSQSPDKTSPEHIGKNDCQLDPGRLNEANLGFFLAAASYLYNFKEGTKEQTNLVSAGASLR